jgi:dsRNA-specific ribonuclease
VKKSISMNSAYKNWMPVHWEDYKNHGFPINQVFYEREQKMKNDNIKIETRKNINQIENKLLQDKMESKIEYNKMENIQKQSETQSETQSEKQQEKNTREWKLKILNWVNKMLNRIYPENSEEKLMFLDEEALKVWTMAFTHESESKEKSYEELEIYGDSVLKLTFTRYLFKRFPDITKREISAYMDRYMSKSFQSNLSKQLGITELIRLGEDQKLNTHISEDCFESFFGALFVLSNEKLAEGLGYINCVNMITSIFNNVYINPDYKYGRPKTQMKEMFEGLGWGTPEEQTSEFIVNNQKMNRANISLTLKGLSYLSNYGIRMNKVLAVAESKNKNDALMLAYDMAFDKLKEYKLTREWFENEKKEKRFQ